MKKDNFNYNSAVKFLHKYIKKFNINFLCFSLGWLLDMVISVIIPVLMGVWMDEIVYYHNINSFLRISLVIAYLLIFSCILYFFIYAQHQHLMNWFTYEIKMDIFKHWQIADASYLNSASSGNIISLLQNYATECLHFLVRNGVHFFNGILKIAIIIIILFFQNWMLGLYIIIAAPISVYISIRLGEKSKKYGRKQRDVYGSYVGWLCEIISSLSNLRIIGAQQKVDNEFCERNKDVFDINIKSDLSKLNAKTFIELTNLVIRLVIYTFVGLLAMNSNATIGTTILVLSYYSMLVNQIKQTSNTYIDGNRRIGYIQSINDYLATPVEDIRNNKPALIVSDGKIEFEKLCFSYIPSNPIINNLSLTVNAGEKIAIIGENGSGKTTLMYVLLGFYKTLRGNIRIDGADLSECSVSSIRSQIGLVAQDVFIFNGSIRENILIGKPSATEREIVNACKKANIWDTVKELPNGLDTQIGVNGINLSGGQKQRLSIARIYLKNPPIVIFDEATSAIDDETEQLVMKEWEEVLSNRTAIIISHRKNTIMMCDSIAIMQDGSIASYGPLEDVMLTDKFKNFFNLMENANDWQKNALSH